MERAKQIKILQRALVDLMACVEDMDVPEHLAEDMPMHEAEAIWDAALRDSRLAIKLVELHR